MPGPPFDGTTIVALGGGTSPSQIGIENDPTLPPPAECGSVNWVYTNSYDLFTGAFSDLNGVDVVLVHGDRREEVGGIRTETVATGVNLSVGPGLGGSMGRPLEPPTAPMTVPGWQQITVISDQDITVGRNVNYSVMGAETSLNNGPVNSSYVASVIQTYDNQKQDENHMPHFDWTTVYANITGSQHQLIGLKTEIDLASAQLNGIKTEVSAAELKVIEVKNTGHAFKIEADGLSSFCTAMQNEVHGFAAKVRALEAKAGPDCQGPPCSVGAN